MKRQIGFHVALWEILLVSAIIIAAVCVGVRYADTAERAAFGATTDAAYHKPYVGVVIAVAGVVQGAGRGKLAGGGGNQYTHWFDIIDPAQRPFIGVRCYYAGAFLPRKGAMVVVEGLVTAPGRLQVNRTTFIE